MTMEKTKPPPLPPPNHPTAGRHAMMFVARVDGDRCVDGLKKHRSLRTRYEF